MATLIISDKVLEKYFRFLKKFDVRSKKLLISKLNKSLKMEIPEENKLAELFGAWDDEKTSDEIIEEIKSSRVDKNAPFNWK